MVTGILREVLFLVLGKIGHRGRVGIEHTLVFLAVSHRGSSPKLAPADFDCYLRVGHQVVYQSGLVGAPPFDARTT